MATDEQLTAEVKELALAAGADLVGVASIDRFDSAPADVHPRSVFSKTQSVIVRAGVAGAGPLSDSSVRAK